MRAERASFAPAIFLSDRFFDCRSRPRFEPHCVRGVVCLVVQYPGPAALFRWQKSESIAAKTTNATAKRKAAPAPERVFSSPFKDLKKMLAGREVSPSRARRSSPKPATPPAPIVEKPAPAVAGRVLDDESFLRRALEGVRPLNGNGNRRSRIPLEPPVTHTIVDEDAEVIAQLSDLVSGQAPFDITESDEYLEGYRVGLDPRLVSQLRRGEFAMQAHFDMHGMIQGAAKEALKEFIIASVRKGLRTVLVVHGRGLRSPGGHSVLKHASAGWLSHGAIGGHVLAFTTARPADGGAGATYVLLKREKSRAPFDILQGAKRREIASFGKKKRGPNRAPLSLRTIVRVRNR